MIKSSLFSVLAAWLTSWAAITLLTLLTGRFPEIEGRLLREVLFFGIWTGATYLVVWFVVVIPIYWFMPERLKAWNRLAKGMLGAAAGALFVCTAMHWYLEIRGVFVAAVLGGFMVGLLSPSSAR